MQNLENDVSSDIDPADIDACFVSVRLIRSRAQSYFDISFRCLKNSSEVTINNRSRSDNILKCLNSKFDFFPPNQSRNGYICSRKIALHNFFFFFESLQSQL